MAAYSAACQAATRLTLPANWGQIGLVDRDLAHFSSRRFRSFGNELHALLMAAFASMENRHRPRARAAGRDCVRLSIGILSAAQAQSPTPTPPPSPTPTPTPSPTPTVINSTVSSRATLTNLGSNFLERLGNQSSNGFNRLHAEQSRRRRRFREHRSAALPDLVRGLRQFHEERHGRRFRRRQRKTWGGVAGIGARVAPGINIGFSVDQSRSASTCRWRCNRRRST